MSAHMLTGPRGCLRTRGFALPMVVLLSMVSAILVAVMLERQASQQLSVNRRLVRYGVHHSGRGVKEVISTWLNTVQNEPIENLTSRSGHALDVELKDGRVISIYLRDGQDRLLGDPTGLDAGKVLIVEQALERLRLAIGAEGMASRVRPAGPIQISAGGAPPDVIAAAVGGILDESQARNYADFLVRERRDGKLMPGKLTMAANQVGATVEQRTKLGELVTDKPRLFRLTAEVRGPDRDQTGQVYILGATRLIDRYSGLVNLESKQQGRGAGSNKDLMQPQGAFLTWEHDPPVETEESE